ncbi:RdgB/HAM1 family non-canonical purine NTP pyrophosphatase [Beggiatoa leptomitoformis]|uniref:dITP/XTP pyrophosphatase n=1 Tax=Beggiatoa leptomitoformis TaxID=288004 RepID=A0A2N9YFF0_9GAMM|nr:RdgB/HAM1 family non-canonical purine NTP pyrophosphatase [Beggiatoa leptomitoformis]ALG68469.1 RdgB/HAM1 family non-canonical purine NTP pyrophosphatase [Beggiatoa leptomitoformis]AUI69197.1 RdgB/HAM1 family non-canonical purine NTP pyrophosphatase [Beggiatoa leptomitoformis]
MTTKTIILASNNQGKIREFNHLLINTDLEIIPQKDLAINDVEETGLSFVENAILKARHAAQQGGFPAIADDSGIEVDALHGAPGIYSARFAGQGASDTENIALLLSRLAAVPEAHRSARYHCVIVYMRHATDPMPIICQGTWEGSVLYTPRGTQGFGYDPVFYVPTHQCSAAELPAAIKNQLSHRSQALQALQYILQSMSYPKN